MESKRAPTKKLAEKWRRPSQSDEINVCKVCDRDLVEPRTLPCMHSFCEDCIFVLLQCYEKQKKLERTFLCPTCKVRIPCHILGKVSKDWLRMFPKKQIMDKMKEAILVVEEMCSPCSMTWKITPATAFCVDCRQYLCPSCLSDHKENAQFRGHNMVDYIVKEMKNTPVANISKFNCKQHNNLRFTCFCEVHKVFLCNSCRESVVHRGCRVTKRVMEATGNIIKAETRLNVINNLKRDERSQGKHLLKMIEQIDGIQEKLELCRQRQVELYCNYVTQATIIEQKTEAIDALKGKLEFDKQHQPHDVFNATMAKVEDILTRYVEVFDDVTLLDEKTLKADVNKSIAEIERIVGNAAFDAFKPKGASETVDIEKRKADPATKKLGKDARAVQIPFTKTLPEVHKLTVPSLEQEPLHVCKKHVDDTLTEQTFQRLGGQFRSVGAVVCKNMAWTAFRVGSSYVMTTAHAVRDIVDPDRKGNSDWSVLEDTGVYLTFDSPLKPDCIKFRLNSQVCYLDDDLNVAVLEVLDSPESFPPPVVLSRKHLPSQDVTDVAVIGYGHGKSQSKHLDIQCDLVKPISERANEALRWLKREERKQRCSLHVKGKDASLVTWHYNEMKDPTRVAIDCCMEYRTHGAPVFCNTGPSGVEVLAILTSSSPECFSEMPRSVQEHHKEYRFEIATLTSAIYTKLAHETRFLAEDIFIRDKNYYDYSKYEVETTFSSTDGSRTMSDVTEYLGTPVSGTADRTMTSSTIRTASTIENK